MPNTTGHIIYKPIGPTLIIGPFNFPCDLANGQILSALIAGNSILFKPSEKTCYSAQLLIECFHSSGFPSGVINLIQGDGEVARRLLKEKALKGVFFTGSKEIGKKILDITHNDLSKLVSLELGGKNTTILHHDSNIEHALLELLKACFLTTGQRCTSTSIVAIHKNIYESFISRFHDLTKKIIIGHPVEYTREPFMGPLVDQVALDAYLLFMGMAKREGIQEIMRGKQLDKTKKGYYVYPL
jgi:succinylglutamic semialdehyde dehydrogenase